MSVFRKGRHATVTLFIGGSKADALTCESWTIKTEGEEIKDGVNGEDSDRLDFEYSHTSLSLKCFNENTRKLKAMVKYTKGLRASEQAKVQFGVKIDDDETGGTFTLKECVIGGWDWASSGRAARQMLTIPIRGRTFDEI